MESRCTVLAGQRLLGELGQHRAGWPVLPDSSSTHCVENIVIDGQRGAHVSDVMSAHHLCRAPAREATQFQNCTQRLHWRHAQRDPMNIRQQENACSALPTSQLHEVEGRLDRLVEREFLGIKKQAAEFVQLPDRDAHDLVALHCGRLG